MEEPPDSTLAFFFETRLEKWHSFCRRVGDGLRSEAKLALLHSDGCLVESGSSTQRACKCSHKGISRTILGGRTVTIYGSRFITSGTVTVRVAELMRAEQHHD